MKLLLGIILSAFITGFFSWSIITYPAETNPWEAMQLTAYKISGQEEKATEMEERIESRQQSPDETEELLNEEIYPHLAYMP